MLSPISHDAEASHEGADVRSWLGLHRLHAGDPAAGREAAKRGILSDECSAGDSGRAVPRPLQTDSPGLRSSPWTRVTAGELWWHFLVLGTGLGSAAAWSAALGSGRPSAQTDPAAAVGGDGLWSGCWWYRGSAPALRRKGFTEELGGEHESPWQPGMETSSKCVK